MEAACYPTSPRVIPIGSFIIATVPLEEEIALRLVPRGRVLSDTKNLLYYFRVGTAAWCSAVASFAADAEQQSRNILRRGIEEVYPEIAHVPIEYSWGGQLGFALDYLPHAGTFEGCITPWPTPATASPRQLSRTSDGELLAGRENTSVWGSPFRRFRSITEGPGSCRLRGRTSGFGIGY
jgi:glycine/D-amino acid oxidase-like deaminating enzyme